MSASRGEVVLQPNYFTSSIYVNALRDDISTLIFRYHEAYSQPDVIKPFSLFKDVWLKLGWPWLHFKVFDSRSRQTFLEITARLFLERTVKTEAPFTRVVALFGMYIFYYTQIKDAAPPLCSIGNIAIPCDHYTALIAMPELLTSPNVQPLQTHVRYVLSCLRRDGVFFILPSSDLGPMNPRDLPREIYTEDGPSTEKRKGRPARREKAKRARLALDGLNEWLSDEEDVDEGVDEALGEYRKSKAGMADDGVGGVVVARLREAVDDESVVRMEGIIGEKGVFGLV